MLSIILHKAFKPSFPFFEKYPSYDPVKKFAYKILGTVL